ncbi:MAG: hypothetical protein Q8P15_01440 [Nanoarchaeota archaeon]|nr:hypothetical protein [Nanoarchaeota archaeon]
MRTKKIIKQISRREKLKSPKNIPVEKRHGKIKITEISNREELRYLTRGAVIQTNYGNLTFAHFYKGKNEVEFIKQLDKERGKIISYDVDIRNGSINLIGKGLEIKSCPFVLYSEQSKEEYEIRKRILTKAGLWRN